MPDRPRARVAARPLSSSQSAPAQPEPAISGLLTLFAANGTILVEREISGPVRQAEDERVELEGDAQAESPGAYARLHEVGDG